MRKIIVLIIFSLFLTCNIEKTEKGLSPILFSHNKIPDIAERVECIFIPLETTDDNLMGYIDKVVILHDKMYILDLVKDRVLRVFDLEGRYLTQVGAIGNGPGEYIGAFNFHLIEQENTILIEDKLQNALFFYDLSTYEYKDTKKVPFNFRELLYLDNNLYVWYTAHGFQNDNKQYFIMMTDSVMKNRRYFIETDFITDYLYGAGYNFIPQKDTYYNYSYFSPVVYKINQDEVYPDYIIEVDGFMFPRNEYLKKEVHKQQQFVDDLISSDYISTYSLFNTDTYLYMCYFLYGKAHIGIYNKKNNESYIYDYSEFTNTLSLPGLRTPFSGTYKEYLICALSANTLKNRSIKRADLKEVADKISAEDNPVLCLLKINE